MEHNLFRSGVRHWVDATLLPNIIRNSSSGENSHRAAAMELLLERSIEDCRKRMLTKSENALQLVPKGDSRGGALPNDNPDNQKTTTMFTFARATQPTTAQLPLPATQPKPTAVSPLPQLLPLSKPPPRPSTSQTLSGFFGPSPAPLNPPTSWGFGPPPTPPNPPTSQRASSISDPNRGRSVFQSRT